MVEEIKIMLGEIASNYTDAEIALAFKQALIEVEDYCKREVDAVMELQAQKIAVQKLLRKGTEGLSGQSASGVSENYLDGWGADVLAVLNRKRKLKVI